MKVSFECWSDGEMFGICPISISYSRRGFPNRRAFYISCRYGSMNFVLRFKWFVKEAEGEQE